MKCPSSSQMPCVKQYYNHDYRSASYKYSHLECALLIDNVHAIVWKKYAPSCVRRVIFSSRIKSRLNGIIILACCSEATNGNCVGGRLKGCCQWAIGEVDGALCI